MHEFHKPCSCVCVCRRSQSRLSSPLACLWADRRRNPWDISSVKLAALEVDAVILHRHAEIFHGQNRPPLATSPGASAAEAGSLDAQLSALLRFVHGTDAACSRSSHAAGPGASAAHARIARGRGIRGPDPAVLVRVGGDVGDELLSRQRQEPGERQRSRVGAGARRVGRRRRREAGEGQIMSRHRVRDLESISRMSSNFFPYGPAQQWVQRKDEDEQHEGGHWWYVQWAHSRPSC